jgi:monoamine oxidase
MHQTDIVIIGAGAAGLAAAQRLRGEDCSSVVLEARARAGGRGWTVTDTVFGCPLDLGCGWLHSADENEFVAIADARGLTVDRSMPPWGKQSGGLGFKANELQEFRAAQMRFWERADAAGDDKPDRPASTLLEEGSRWNGLLNAISSYINGVELDHVSVRDFSNYRDTEVNWRIREGYGALIASLGTGLDIRYETPANLIDHSGTRLRIETPSGVLQARAAIITAPSPLIAREALRFTPALPDKLSAVHALPLGLADKVFLRTQRPEDFPVDGHLYGANDRAEIASFNLRPLGRPLIEAYFGGAYAQALEQQGEAAFVAAAIDQLASLMGNDIRSRLTPVRTTAWASDPWACGSYSYARVGQADARAALAAPHEDRLFFAGEACSVQDFSTAHGAYRTGIVAAEAALRALAQ